MSPRIRPGGYPLVAIVNPLLPDDVELRVTRPSGRSHTPAVDEGRTGWRRHVVRDGRALCGLRPRHGWGTDLFEDGMEFCARCAVALGACKTCAGSMRIRVMVDERRSEGRPCPTCRTDAEASP